MNTIDIHTHFFPEVDRDSAARLDPQHGPWLRKLGDGRGMIMTGDREFRPIDEACWSPAARVEAMDRSGVDVQIICATPVLFGYPYPAPRAEAWAARMNDLALEICTHAPRRLRALCQVPLQDTDRACRELSRAKACGHIGVQIGNHVGPRELDDEDLVAFLAHCAAEDMPVLVHPWDMLGRDRMSRYMLQWLVAMPAETQLGILSLILSGGFERLPSATRLCFAHGGGSFPYLLGRVDNAWHHRDIVREDCPHPPSHYVSRFHVDSAVFDEDALRLLLDVMGADRVMMGSDYPFPLGEQSPGALVRATGKITDSERTRVLERNARAFFKIE